MESIFFDANPTMKQFTDNAQRANNLLHRAQDRELKRTKTSKTSHISDADFSSEASMGGEDMMGGMDLGDYRGGGNPFQQFGETSYSEEQNRQLKEDIARSRMEQEQECEQERSIASFIQALKGETEETSETSAGDNTVPAAAAGKALQTETETACTLNGRPETEYSELSAESRQLQEKREKPQSEEMPKKTEDRRKTEKSGIKDLKAEIKTAVSPSPEKAELSAEKSRTAPQPAAEKKNAQWNSLLSFDEGFIIADPKNIVLQQESGGEEIPSFETMEIPLVEETTARAEELILSMIAETPSGFVTSFLLRHLSAFGVKALKLCSDFGIKIRICPEGDKRAPLSASAEALYLFPEKQCILREEALRGSGWFVPSRFYFAMAFDHAMGEDGFSSLKSPAVLSNYKLCKEGEKGHLFSDYLSSVSPVQYFAQSVESYLREPAECPESPIFGKEELYDYDRSMYSYIDYLFREINRDRTEV